MTVQLGTDENLQNIELLPEKALFWAQEQILCLSDIHFGKAESLQTVGINVPIGAHFEDLKTLDKIIKVKKPKTVLVLGDFIHSKTSWNLNLQKDLLQFFNQHPDVEWKLLLGNHEKGSKDFLANLPLELIEGHYTRSPFTFTHGHAKTQKGQFLIQGHVHPVVRMSFGPTRLRLPCFTKDKRSLTLPSFGSLTGGFEIEPKDFEQVYACTPSSVVTIKA